eukprot:scaffold143596_cov33-Tisochrysis_lutea.AAC.1
MLCCTPRVRRKGCVAHCQSRSSNGPSASIRSFWARGMRASRDASRVTFIDARKPSLDTRTARGQRGSWHGRKMPGN